MLDRRIPFCNIIMRCDRILPMEIRLPEGYAIRAYQPGDEAAWAALHTATGDFASSQEAEDYFRTTYAEDFQRTLVAVSPDGAPVGVITAWHDDRQGRPVRSIHWLAVAEAHQRQGLGRALCQSCLQLLRREDNAAPVYLHTQPWSWKAVLLYASLGFRLQKQDSFAAYVNEYAQAVETLRPLLTAEQLSSLEENAGGADDFDLSCIKFDEKGLVPAIAQDARTGAVLMLAYMNAESLRATLDSGYATYFSRSRQKLWRKGETSGHLQKILAIRYDCDGDAILLTVEQTGPACHTGEYTCFHHDIVKPEAAAMPATAQVVEDVYRVIADRAANPKPGSYTNYLLDKGKEKICKKVGEEASEAIIAAMKDNPAELCGEAGDLIYHLLVLLYRQGVTPQNLWDELSHRR